MNIIEQLEELGARLTNLAGTFKSVRGIYELFDDVRDTISNLQALADQAEDDIDAACDELEAVVAAIEEEE